ncbi:hypothetical protein LEP1GSC021_3126 [Leptospira noguchii str. 1993005606]|nr:hypothetical protein LEP1GSC021_3126 [Leptospira noguchii str. 1993005606]
MGTITNHGLYSWSLKTWELLQSRTLQLILENVGTITNHGLYS